MVHLLVGRADDVGEVRDEIGGPADAAFSKPGRDESVAAVLRDDALDGGVVGLRRGGAEGQRHRAEAEFEQAVAAPSTGSNSRASASPAR